MQLDYHLHVRVLVLSDKALSRGVFHFLLCRCYLLLGAFIEDLLDEVAEIWVLGDDLQVKENLDRVREHRE